MPVKIVVEGLETIAQRYKLWPRALSSAMVETLKACLVDLQGSVPPYPIQNPDSTYRRTGTLGRSLGSSPSGSPEGKPDIFEVRKENGGWIGQFGTRLDYAPFVIGERTQAAVHKGRWWTILTVAKFAAPKIKQRFAQMANSLAKWLGGAGK